MNGATISGAPFRRAAQRVHYAWVVFAATLVILLLAAGFRASPAVLIDPLSEEFGWSRADIGLAVSVNVLLYGLMGDTTHLGPLELVEAWSAWEVPEIRSWREEVPPLLEVLVEADILVPPGGTAWVELAQEPVDRR